MQWHDRIGRRLKLRDLHILLAVVQSRSMAKAASELAISQPAVSKAIAEMEHTLGLRLLDRTRRGVEPTSYGRVLIRRGLTIFDELKQAAQELDFLADPAVGELRIGSSESMAAGLLPAIIDRFSRQYPRVTLTVAQPLLRQCSTGNFGIATSICCSAGFSRHSRRTIWKPNCCATTSLSSWRGIRAAGLVPVGSGLRTSITNIGFCRHRTAFPACRP